MVSPWSVLYKSTRTSVYSLVTHVLPLQYIHIEYKCVCVCVCVCAIYFVYSIFPSFLLNTISSINRTPAIRVFGGARLYFSLTKQRVNLLIKIILIR
jgi:hypothetical protein